MTPAEIEARMAKVLAEPITNASPWWWLSFADGSQPKGQQFLGVAIVGPAANVGQAVELARMHGANPGGEVMGSAMQSQLRERIPAEYLDRLLTKAEALKLNAMLMDQSS